MGENLLPETMFKVDGISAFEKCMYANFEFMSFNMREGLLKKNTRNSYVFFFSLPSLENIFSTNLCRIIIIYFSFFFLLYFQNVYKHILENHSERKRENFY